MPFYRDHIYPHLVSMLGDPKPIREVRRRIVPLAQGKVLEIGVGPGVNFVYFWDTAIELDPAAEELDQTRRFSLCHPERLRELFDDSGLIDVCVHTIEVTAVFRDFDDYWTPFLSGRDLRAPGYVISLDEDRRARLRERLRANLPIGADGSIHLIARAWAVRGSTGAS